MHWLSMPAKALARDNTPHDLAATVRFGDSADGFDLTADAGAISVSLPFPTTAPDAIVRGPGHVLVGMF